MNQLEDLIIAEARRQGVHPSSAALMQTALDLAGSGVVDGAIVLPGKGVLAVSSYVRTLREALPSGFKPIGHSTTENPAPTGNVTIDMKRKVAASRLRELPSDWDRVRRQVVGKTAAAMDAIAAARLATRNTKEI
jgi:hypothetical protein